MHCLILGGSKSGRSQDIIIYTASQSLICLLKVQQHLLTCRNLLLQIKILLSCFSLKCSSITDKGREIQSSISSSMLFPSDTSCVGVSSGRGEELVKLRQLSFTLISRVHKHLRGDITRTIGQFNTL